MGQRRYWARSRIRVRRRPFRPASDLTAQHHLYRNDYHRGQDLAGNALASNYVWSFTTGAAQDVTRPTVISTDPANNATDVSLNKVITAIFGQGMDPSTIDDYNRHVKARNNTSAGDGNSYGYDGDL